MARHSDDVPPARDKLAIVRDCLLILFVALFPRVFAAYHSVSPARDSYRFVDAAKTFESLPFHEAARSVNVHPAYPIALSSARKLYAAATGVDGPYAWYYAGQILSIVCYCGFLLAAYAAGRRLWSPRIAMWGCMAISIVPRQVFYAADVLSDSLHAMFWMSAFACLVRGWERIDPAESSANGIDWSGTRLLIAGGVLAAAAYWTRVEALILPVSFVGATCLAQLTPRWRQPWKQWSVRLCAFVIPYALLAGGYMALIGNLSARGTAMVVMGVQNSPSPMLEDVPQPETTIPAVPASKTATASPPPSTSSVKAEMPDDPIDGVDLTPRPYTHMEGYERVGVAAAAWELLMEVGQETRGWLLGLALFAMLFRQRTPTRMPSGLLVAMVLLTCGAMLIVLRVRAGYLAGRYMTPVLPFIAMYAMTGAEAAIGLIQRLPRFPWERAFTADGLRTWRTAFTGVSIAVLGAVLCAPLWGKPMHRYRHGHMVASEWLKDHVDPQEPVFDPARVSSFFADRRRWEPAETPHSGLPVRIAVIDTKLVYRTDALVHQTIDFFNEHGRPVARFPRQAGKDEIGIYIFELQPEKISQTTRGRVH